MTDEFRHSQVIDLQVERCVHTNVFGQPDCEALVARRVTPRGYCRTHDDVDRAGRSRKKERK